jgi:hypothetical protein
LSRRSFPAIRSFSEGWSEGGSGRVCERIGVGIPRQIKATQAFPSLLKAKNNNLFFLDLPQQNTESDTTKRVPAFLYFPGLVSWLLRCENLSPMVGYCNL